MANAPKSVVIDGVTYTPDHSGLLANDMTNPVVDLAEAPVEVPETVVAAPHDEGVTVNEDAQAGSPEGNIAVAEAPAAEAPAAPTETPAETPAEAPVETPTVADTAAA